jgi:hypothetical protein
MGFDSSQGRTSVISVEIGPGTYSSTYPIGTGVLCLATQSPGLDDHIHAISSEIKLSMELYVTQLHGVMHN